MNEMKATLGTILHHFELTLDPDRPPQKDLQIILRPKNGLFLKLNQDICDHQTTCFYKI